MIPESTIVRALGISRHMVRLLRKNAPPEHWALVGKKPHWTEAGYAAIREALGDRFGPPEKKPGYVEPDAGAGHLDVPIEPLAEVELDTLRARVAELESNLQRLTAAGDAMFDSLSEYAGTETVEVWTQAKQESK